MNTNKPVISQKMRDYTTIVVNAKALIICAAYAKTGFPMMWHRYLTLSSDGFYITSCDVISYGFICFCVLNK